MPENPLPNIEKMLQKEIVLDKMKTQVPVPTTNINDTPQSNFATVNKKQPKLNLLKYTKSLPGTVDQVMTKSKVTGNDIEMIKSALRNHFLFKHLSSEVL